MFKGYSGFQRFGLYETELLGNKMDEEEFQAIVDQASKVVQIMYSRKR
jgi:hypothetical protein